MFIIQRDLIFSALLYVKINMTQGSVFEELNENQVTKLLNVENFEENIMFHPCS